VKGRLARAREILRRRLPRRGLGATAGALAAALSLEGLAVAVPPALTTAAVRAAVPVALDRASLNAVASAPVAALARRVLRRELLARVAAFVALTAVLTGSGAGLWLARGDREKQVAANTVAEMPEPQLLASFDEERHYRGQPVPIAFSADGRHLAVLARRNGAADEVVLQEIATGKKIAQHEADDGLCGVAANGKALALVYGSELPASVRTEVRDLANLKLLRELKADKDEVMPADTIVTGETLVLVGAVQDQGLPAVGGLGGVGGFPAGMAGFPAPGSGPQGILIQELAGKGKPRLHALPDDVTIHSVQVASPAADSRLAVLLLRTEDGMRLETIDLASGKSRKLTENVEATGLAVGAHGKVAVLRTSESTLQTWDIVAGKAGRELRDGDNTIVAFAVSPDGQTLATAGSDRTVKLWDLTTGKVERQLKHPRTQGLIFSTDGRLLATASPEEVKVWSLRR
jgi:hypothetical protein